MLMLLILEVAEGEAIMLPKCSIYTAIYLTNFIYASSFLFESLLCFLLLVTNSPTNFYQLAFVALSYSLERELEVRDCDENALFGCLTLLFAPAMPQYTLVPKYSSFERA